MSTEFEVEVRKTLRRVGDGISPAVDPWTAFTLRERRHSRQRIGRWVVVGLAASGLVAAAAGVVPVPNFVPAVPISAAAFSGTRLDDAPTRGSLAADTAWLAEFRQQVPGDGEDPDGRWQVVDRDGIKIHFAGDVSTGRVVLASVTYRFGLVKDTQLVWFAGPAGAVPGQMREAANEDLTDVTAHLSGSDTEPGYLVVVAPSGATIRTSLTQEYGADGRNRRSWQQADPKSGIATVSLPPSSNAPSARVNVTLNGKVLFDSAPSVSWGAEGEAPVDVVPGKAVAMALKAARGRALSPKLAKPLVTAALDDAKLKRGTTAFTIPWTGTINDRRAAMVELRPASGGHLFYVIGSELYARLLVPAQGADSRPISWRDLDSHEQANGRIGVVLPAGTVRAELVSGGSSTPLSITDGYAQGQAKAAVPVSVRAYGKGGRLIGESEVPAASTFTGGLPGDARDTRLVP